MQTLNQPQTNAPAEMPGGKRRRRFSPLMLIGMGVTLAIILAAGGVVVWTNFASRAAAVNMDCTLIVPPDPLTAKGLATPYQLVATNPNNGVCNEANKAQAAFVQGAVIDPATGQISIYNPLVIDQGTQPAVAPTVPTLPNNGIVALWFGFNGNNLTLQGTNNSLAQGRCVNGQQGSIFGQFAYCNAPTFFAVANFNIRSGRLQVPALGTGKDGLTCPTVRDFSVVDMDQSDNVTTTYVISNNGQMAQGTAANIATLQNQNTMNGVQTPQMQVNASDNRLLAVALDGALGCTAWQAPDLADPGKMVNALPLDELQAAAHQGAPVAIVPLGDPMTLNNNQPSLAKTTLYRVGVDQPLATPNNANTTTYCTNLLNVQPARMQKDMALTMNRPSPDPAAANSLFTFLAQRFVATYEANGLNCMALLNKPDPIKVTTDGNGVATAATINLNGTGNANGGGAAAAAPNCRINGTTLAGCAGNAPVNLNGAQANVAFDQAANQINITAANGNANQNANGNQGANNANGNMNANGNQDANKHQRKHNGNMNQGNQAAVPTADPNQANQAAVPTVDANQPAAQPTADPNQANLAAMPTVDANTQATQATQAAQPQAQDQQVQANANNANGNQNGNQKAAAPNCAVDGKVVNGCRGFATFNGRPLIFNYSQANNQVTIISFNLRGQNNQGQNGNQNGQQ